MHVDASAAKRSDSVLVGVAIVAACTLLAIVLLALIVDAVPSIEEGALYVFVGLGVAQGAYVVPFWLRARRPRPRQARGIAVGAAAVFLLNGAFWLLIWVTFGLGG